MGRRPRPPQVKQHQRPAPYSPFTPRRSRRLAAKNGGMHVHSVTKAQRVVMKRLGVIEDENKVDDGDILRYLELFRTPLAPCHVQALTALCNLEEKGVEGDGVC